MEIQYCFLCSLIQCYWKDKVCFHDSELLSLIDYQLESRKLQPAADCYSCLHLSSVKINQFFYIFSKIIGRIIISRVMLTIVGNFSSLNNISHWLWIQNKCCRKTAGKTRMAFKSKTMLYTRLEGAVMQTALVLFSWI